MTGGVKSSGLSPGPADSLAISSVSAKDGPLVSVLFPEARGRF